MLAQRHRFIIRDVFLAVGLFIFLALAVYEYSLLGSVTDDKRVEFEELLALGVAVIAAIFYLGWRRVVEQDKEIKRRIVAERRAHELAHTDALTGLANRRQFESALTAAVHLPIGPKDVHAVLMLDLNGFKKINDVYGHAEGDELLAHIAQRLKAAARERDVVARFGGDEFAIVAHHLAGVEGATNVALRIMHELQQPITTGNRTHQIGVGIGVALMPRDGQVAEEVLRKADIALYRAKSSSKTEVRFFEPEMDVLIREHDFIERELTSAIGTSALLPWYQPIVDLKTNRVIAFEALARWSHPSLGQVPPDRFIPIAEDCGLMSKLTDWLLHCAATEAKRWPNDVMLSFNISASELKDRTLGLRVLNILAQTGLAAHRLELEITESAIVRDLEAAKDVLCALRDVGVHIALDDFGTGYSSLHHLRNLKLDKIKIDRSFVHAMLSEPQSATIIQALAGLGNGLGLTITAEGIEANEERDALVRLGCDQGQGYLFSRAVPAAETAGFFGSATNDWNRTKRMSSVA